MSSDFWVQAVGDHSREGTPIAAPSMRPRTQSRTQTRTNAPPVPHLMLCTLPPPPPSDATALSARADVGAVEYERQRRLLVQRLKTVIQSVIVR